MQADSTPSSGPAPGQFVQDIESVVDQLRRHGDCVFDPADIVEVRRIRRKDDRTAQLWCPAAELPALASQLLAENVEGSNIYAGGLLPKI